MTNTATAAKPAAKKKGYNFYNVIPLTAAEASVNANGKDKLKFRASLTIDGELRERTILVQGDMVGTLNEQIGTIEKGTPIALRCVFERAKDNADGSKGGEFLSVVGIPRPKAA